MPCEHHKNALIEAAASGGTPQGKLRAHLEQCASCRQLFDAEQSLFATIDSGLQVTANADVPPSLVPRVRSRLDEVAAPRFRWLQPLVFASAGAALAVAVFLLVRPHRVLPEDVAKQSHAVTPSAVPGTNTSPEKGASEDTQIAAFRVNHSHTVRNSTNRPSAASSNPEVLVPRDEREAFARFVAVLNKRSDVAAALLAKASQKDDVVTAALLQIPDIEIKPLEGTETETSDGPGEKH